MHKIPQVNGMNIIDFPVFFARCILAAVTVMSLNSLFFIHSFAPLQSVGVGWHSMLCSFACLKVGTCLRWLCVFSPPCSSPNLVSIPEPNQTRTLLKGTYHVHAILCTMCRQSTISSQESVTIPPGFWIFTQNLFPLFVL